MLLSLQDLDGAPGRPAVTERLTQLGDAAGGAVGAVARTISVGQGAHSHVVLAATQGLLTLAGRVPLVGHLAAALQDLCDVYQVRAASWGGTLGCCAGQGVRVGVGPTGRLTGSTAPGSPARSSWPLASLAASYQDIPPSGSKAPLPLLRLGPLGCLRLAAILSTLVSLASGCVCARMCLFCPVFPLTWSFGRRFGPSAAPWTRSWYAYRSWTACCCS
jgi:hypothetical protein